MVKSAGEKNENLRAAGIYGPLIQCVRGRRSIRTFKETPIPNEMIMKILEAGRWAPSGANSQPWEFIIIKNRDTLEEICEIFVNDREQRIREKVNFPGSSKNYLGKVPALIVVVADPRWKQAYPNTYITPALRRMYSKNQEVIFVQSVAAAIQNMFLAAASLRLGMAWLSGFAEDRMGKKLRRLLKIPEPIRLMAGLPVGYPKVTHHTSARRPLTDFIHYKTYDPSRLKTDDFFQNYCEKERNLMTYSAGAPKK